MEGLPGGTILQGRKNIILTSKKDYLYTDAVIVHNMQEALDELAKVPPEQVYIIGGGKVYKEFLPYCDRAYITKINYAYDADTYFPNLDKLEEWEMTHDSEEQTYYDLEYCFTQYRRIRTEK